MIEKIEVTNVTTNLSRRKILAKVISIVLLAVVGVLGLVFTVGQLSERQGLFEINAITKGKGYISLSNTADFAEPTTVITAQSVADMTNISGVRDLPPDLDDHDGTHNGENYFAHTFYLRNTGDKAIDVSAVITIGDTFRNAQKAMWFRVYVNGVATTYAHARDDGMAEFGTQPFASDKSVMEQIYSLAPDQTIKFTIVIWLEGDDPDCIDDIQGGFARFGMDFTIVDEQE